MDINKKYTKLNELKSQIDILSSFFDILNILAKSIKDREKVSGREICLVKTRKLREIVNVYFVVTFY